ncbi:efflux RND transporter periplasmic adaptor subunit [Brevibacillus sp. SYP-B805]|uniref:efflux RND transporter periplasmic adaptor subunit n=1 Tax=Brevibacillus sp. SYP-B805 TaxID=1578199 RepID=UPI0013ED1686|nr:efflux RND transporter periplasmic adaptor subunit [Brevibacillus sp. SYP-B805]NGQ94834.1 efflux RND transporter periplasmic adaptor subunit [Brevibacillus sp. SYP-B805]
MNRKSTITCACLSLLASLALVAAGCSSPESAAAPDNSLPAIKVWNVGSVSEGGVIASGKVAAAEEIQVVSKLAGKMASVNVQEGDVVKQGAVLAQLDAADYIQQVKQAESGIASAQAKLADARAGTRTQELERLESVVEQAKAAQDVAQNTYNRMKALYETGAISQAEFEKTSLELEKARTGYDQAKAQLDLAKAGATPNSLAALQAEVDRLRSSLDLAKITLANTRITAPISGIVARRSIDPGEMAQPGVPLFTLVNMNDVKVEASVQAEAINRIRTGSKVAVRVSSLGNQTFAGTVEFVSPISDANSTTFPVKIRVNNREGLLRAGMVAEVLLDQQAGSALKIPASAVVQKEGKAFVYKLDGDVVHLTPLTIQDQQQDWVTIAGGLAAGDKIVITPDARLTDGGKVRVN